MISLVGMQQLVYLGKFNLLISVKKSNFQSKEKAHSLSKFNLW